MTESVANERERGVDDAARSQECGCSFRSVREQLFVPKLNRQNNLQ